MARLFNGISLASLRVKLIGPVPSNQKLNFIHNASTYHHLLSLDYQTRFLPVGLFPDVDASANFLATKLKGTLPPSDLPLDDAKIQALAANVRHLWNKLEAQLEKEIRKRDPICRDLACQRGSTLLGLHIFCTLEAGFFTSSDVVAFFDALNELCHSIDVSPNREVTNSCLYAIFGSDFTESKSGVNFYEQALRTLRYVGVGNPYRPYSHFQRAAVLTYEKKGFNLPKANKGKPSLMISHLHKTYDQEKVPFLSVTHAGKCRAFVELLEGSCIRYFCGQRHLDLANKQPGMNIGGILGKLLPEIESNIDTFNVIASLYSFNLFLISPLNGPSNPFPVPFKEAVSMKATQVNLAKAGVKFGYLPRSFTGGISMRVPYKSMTSRIRTVFYQDPRRRTVENIFRGVLARTPNRWLLHNSRILLLAYTEYYANIVARLFVFDDSGLVKIIRNQFTLIGQKSSHLRQLAMECAESETYFTHDSLIAWVKINQPESLKSVKVCPRVFIGNLKALQLTGLLVQECENKEKDENVEEGVKPVKRILRRGKVWRLAVREHSMPKCFFQDGRLLVPYWPPIASFLWENKEMTAKEICALLATKISKVPTGKKIAVKMRLKKNIFETVPNRSKSNGNCGRAELYWRLTPSFRNFLLSRDAKALAMRSFYDSIQGPPLPQVNARPLPEISFKENDTESYEKEDLQCDSDWEDEFFSDEEQSGSEATDDDDDDDRIYSNHLQESEVPSQSKRRVSVSSNASDSSKFSDIIPPRRRATKRRRINSTDDSDQHLKKKRRIVPQGDSDFEAFLSEDSDYVPPTSKRKSEESEFYGDSSSEDE